MGQQIATAALTCLSGKRGDTGTETIQDVRRYHLRPNVQYRMLRGRKMPKDCRATFGSMIIALETTNVTELHKHLVRATTEKLICELEDYTGKITRTHYRVQAYGGGDSKFPAPEDGEETPTHELRFLLLEKVDGDGIDTAFDDARSQRIAFSYQLGSRKPEETP